MLVALLASEAAFLVVGAHAMAVHGVPRATGDLDVWIRPDLQNAGRVWSALLAFGAPVEALNLSMQDLTKPGIVFQIGLPPRRVDILTEIDGVTFERAWESRVVERIGDLDVPFLGRDSLLQNKRASGRAKDLTDIELLEDRGGDQHSS